MGKCMWVAALCAASWLVGCGGDIRPPPTTAAIGIDGMPRQEPTPTTPGTPGSPGEEPPPSPPTSLKNQVWVATDPTGPQRRVVIDEDEEFIGWWQEDHASGPPSYGVFSGTLRPTTTEGHFASDDSVTSKLPQHQQIVGLVAMDTPQAGNSRLTHGDDTVTVHSDPQAHEALDMAQRSGRYAGELQLPGKREPVSLRWEPDGRLSLMLTDVPRADCRASGQASPKAGAPVRVLAFELVFAGAGCPQLSTGSNLAGLTINGAIDTTSADQFVLFGFDPIRTMAMVLPATRVPELALQGAWTGALNTMDWGFRIAVLDDHSLIGWQYTANYAGGSGPAHAVVRGNVAPPAPGASGFGGGQLREWIPTDPATVSVPSPGFVGPLPVSDEMQGTFGLPASWHAAPIGHIDLPASVRNGSYSGDLQVAGLRTPASLQWGVDGTLKVLLSSYPGCTLNGHANALAGGPVRWRSFDLEFSGAACPTVLGIVPLARRTVRGAIDAKSGDEFVLFGLDDSQQVALAMAARRLP